MLHLLHPIPAHSIHLIVFDLDGTLIDSRKDLTNSINAMLAEFGRQPLPEEIIATYIGDGASMLVRRALGDPEDEPLVENALQHFLAHYRQHKLDFTYVYPGVFESLEVLKTLPDGTERKMAVLTNKPAIMSRHIIEGLGVGGHFFRIIGGDSLDRKKPDPLGVETLMREAGADRTQTMIVGDSAVDVATARNAGVACCGVTYGFQPESLHDPAPDLVVDRMDQFADWLLNR